MSRMEAAMPDHDRMLQRQKALAELGRFALQSDDMDQILGHACRIAGKALGARRTRILELQDGGRYLFVRTGAGCAPGIIGRHKFTVEAGSVEAEAVRTGEVVIAEKAAEADVGQIPGGLKEIVVAAQATVPILLPGKRTYGLLQAEAVAHRTFQKEDADFLRTYVLFLGSVIDRLLKLTDLRATEERFRLTVEEALDYAIFMTDPEDYITDWFPGASAVFGWSAEEAVGQHSSMLFTQADREEGAPFREVEVARATGLAPNVRWHLRKDGSRVFIDGSVRALRDEDGELKGFLKMGQDVTERHAAEEGLRESEERFRQFSDASSDMVWIRDAETLAFEYLSPAFEQIYGCSRSKQLARNTLEHWLELLHPEDRQAAAARLRSVRAGERLDFEFRIIRSSDGEIRWIRNTAFPLGRPDGPVRRLGGIAKDITEEKSNADRLEVLVAELQHRSRNLLGVISSVAAKTLEEGGSVQNFRTRLQALSRAQGLLSQSGSDTVEVGAMVRAELAAHAEAGPPKVAISGPSVRLTSRQVQNFALALHELTTNAVKHGALKDKAGQLSISWAERRNETGRRRLVLDWRETGVRVDPAVAGRRGYGRQLIEKALSYALRAKTEYTLGPDGVRCRIELPLV